MLPLHIKCDKRSYLSERISQLKCIQIAQLPNSGVGYLQFLMTGGQKAKDRRTSVKLSVTGFHCCKTLVVRPHNGGCEKPGTQAFMRGVSLVSVSVNNGTGRSATTTVPQWQGNEVLRPPEGDHLSHYQASIWGKMLAKGKGRQSGRWQRDPYQLQLHINYSLRLGYSSHLPGSLAPLY